MGNPLGSKYILYSYMDPWTLWVGPSQGFLNPDAREMSTAKHHSHTPPRGLPRKIVGFYWGYIGIRDNKMETTI